MADLICSIHSKIQGLTITVTQQVLQAAEDIDNAVLMMVLPAMTLSLVVQCHQRNSSVRRLT